MKVPNMKLNYQIVFITVFILVIPLLVIGIYFFTTTISNMEEIGKERGRTSAETAHKLLENMGNNLLSITNSNSHWEDFRVAITEGNLPWISVNVNENLSSVESLDFIVTMKNDGEVLLAAEKQKDITTELNYEKIFNRLKSEKEFYGLIDTSKGLALIAVSKITNEDGNAPPAGSLIFGSLLKREAFHYIEETLQVELGVLNKAGVVYSSNNKINLDVLRSVLVTSDGTNTAYKTILQNDTIYVEANTKIKDISNDTVGLIHLTYPLKTSTDIINNLKMISISAGIVVFVLIIILVFVLQRRILLPLKHFKLALEEVAAGTSVNEIPAHILSKAESNIVVLFDQLHKLSFYDYLTNLPNRRFIYRYLEQSVLEAQENQSMVAVLYLDLDRFKNINDSLGHNTGDSLLTIVANRLSSVIGDKGKVGRLGGDEFAVVLTNIENTTEIMDTVERVTAIFNDSIIIEEYDLFVTSSIGISIFPNDGKTVESLFMNADVAMYRAKEQGRNKYQFYNSTMNSSVLDKLQIEFSLRKALDNNEMFIVYQPKINIQSNEVIGMEALVRWVHPELGTVGPSDFIPIAEETGLIMSIGEWVLKTACAQNKLWQDQGLPPIKVSVNISARQFQKNDIVDTISRVLDETGLEAKWLELEITESTVMSYADETIQTLKKLDQMGISVSIDDFGTGYSSLSYLKLFPIKSLKIDRSFIKDIDKENGDLAIAKSVITLAHALNFEVVAEGVENIGQLEILRKEECDVLQGYYYSPPITAEAFEDILKDRVTSYMGKG